MDSKSYEYFPVRSRGIQGLHLVSFFLSLGLLVFGVTNRDRVGEMDQTPFDEPLAALLDRELTSRYGPMVSNDNLRIVLGYSSKEAFRQALSRKTIPIPVFEIENRRGKFALTKDIASWIAAQRERAFSRKVAEMAAPAIPAAEIINKVGGNS